MIALNALTCRLDGRLLLDAISLSLEAGCTALLGPNGAGKSTLLRLCADGGRLLAPARLDGRLLLDGQPLREYAADALAPRRAFLPQQHAETLRLDVADILELALWPHGGPARHPEAVPEAAARWDLTGLLARPYDALSGGERQRVQLARTWLQMKLHPLPSQRLWLLDEPQAALDLPHQQRLRSLLREEAALGALVLFSTHDINFALRTAERLILLKDGRLHAAGPAAALADPTLLQAVFGVAFERVVHPGDGLPWLLPR